MTPWTGLDTGLCTFVHTPALWPQLLLTTLSVVCLFYYNFSIVNLAINWLCGDKQPRYRLCRTIAHSKATKPTRSIVKRHATIQRMTSSLSLTYITHIHMFFGGGHMWISICYNLCHSNICRLTATCPIEKIIAKHASHTLVLALVLRWKNTLQVCWFFS